ncbi:hypothetical protein SLEP1_g20013 [Rubroshorea leprosula]|uniref:Retrotransposon gag domain-containing protein n=1 Tax=Rubroshorea leprosula TaxID=152421 RepID=A0AAV5J194_9ROSI|nr:hypothetical protein SLEP1_g20013 [Rubroshorea leprosula]
MVLSWILNTISKDLHDSVAYAEGEDEIWSDLQECFSQGNASRVHELKLELATLTQQTKMVAAYFTKLKPIWDELQAYEPTPICTCGCTYGAAKEYMKTQDMDPLPPLNKVDAMATKEEKQQAVAALRGPAMEAMALAAKVNPHTRTAPLGKVRCDHCKKTGHTKDRCFEIIGYPPNWKLGIAKTKGKGDPPKLQSHEKDMIFTANVFRESQDAGGSQDQSPITGLTKDQYAQLLSLLGGPCLEEVDWSG